MTELRIQMDNAMLVRGMAERTRETYLAAVARLARHYHRSPDQLSPAQVQAYAVHMLREEHLAWSTCNIAVQAFRFLYHTTLGHPEPTFTIPGPKQRRTLPEILSPAEVRRVIEATVTRKQRAVLATTYAAGLRVSEVVRVAYLGRYTHRVAICNDRLVNIADGQVRFRWTDHAHGHRLKTMTLSAAEFLRRFLLHVLPGRFVRIRYFGFLANRGRTGKLALCRAVLAAVPPEPPAPAEPVAALMFRLPGVNITQCRICRAGQLRVTAVFRPGHLPPPLDSA